MHTETSDLRSGITCMSVSPRVRDPVKEGNYKSVVYSQNYSALIGTFLPTEDVNHNSA